LGAWSPVLASRLLGPLQMSGKQTGWIYGTIYLGCAISPLIAGQIADRWVPRNISWPQPTWSAGCCSWPPLATNTLTSGSCYFSDPQWTNYPGRYYRLRLL